MVYMRDAFKRGLPLYGGGSRKISRLNSIRSNQEAQPPLVEVVRNTLIALHHSEPIKERK
jgi:hypothetical protein